MKYLRSVLWLQLACVLPLMSQARGQTLLFERYGGAAGEEYGRAVAAVGDVDADGTDDWAAGSPGDDAVANNAGSVVVYSGATQQVLHTWWGAVADERFGTAVAGVEDLDGDGHAEVAVGSPGAGLARVFSGATGLALYTLGPGGSTGFGQSVAGGGEIDGDGVPDLLVGEPYEGAQWRGRMRIFSGADGSQIRRHDGTGNWRNFGWSVAFLDDLDGDGRDEFAVGAPTLNIVGNAPYVRAFDGATGAELWTDNAIYNDAFGFALASIADVSGDGLRDLLVGAMQDPGVGCACKGKGFVRALDGASGAQLYQVDNPSSLYVGYGWSIAVVGDLDGNGFEDFAASRPGTEGCSGGHLALEVRDGEAGALILSIAPPAGSGSFGASLAFGDANGDGLGDLLCGAPCSDPSGANSGTVYAFTLVRDVTPYCAAKVNSQGCTPAIQGVGTPSATLPQPFRVKAFQVLNNKNGLLFYGFAPKAAPFQGGTLCVQAPTRRTQVQSSNGNPPPDDCSGFYSYDFNQRIRSGVDPALVAGEEVFCQYWSRDPTAPWTTGLTDALAFFIHP